MTIMHERRPPAPAAPQNFAVKRLEEARYNADLDLESVDKTIAEHTQALRGLTDRRNNLLEQRRQITAALILLTGAKS